MEIDRRRIKGKVGRRERERKAKNCVHEWSDCPAACDRSNASVLPATANRLLTTNGIACFLATSLSAVSRLSTSDVDAASDADATSDADAASDAGTDSTKHGNGCGCLLTAAIMKVKDELKRI